MTTSTSGARRTRVAANLCAAVSLGSLIAAPAAIASPLSDLLDGFSSGSAGSAGPETTSPVPPAATVQFLAEFPAGTTASLVKTSSSCIELPADPTRVSTVDTSVTLTVGQNTARERQGRSGNAIYTVVVTAPTQRWCGGSG
ncbi:hypothetical protein [Rhodococcus sp. IEGM 1379]|uniref:hypothetical protein n=1 Tax=Rhodococcus sp. IEGM 1379 TaxID=3047086 RepID=UPI0024B6B4E1|nr:hypothetical protein [Rhodococcus sp. IEGM 1379]MDI9917315.1 hypothetical protein [Rhodococcus sp. IEGM 1379]